jgi:hypothetical protein
METHIKRPMIEPPERMSLRESSVVSRLVFGGKAALWFGAGAIVTVALVGLRTSKAGAHHWSEPASRHGEIEPVRDTPNVVEAAVASMTSTLPPEREPVLLVKAKRGPELPDKLPSTTDDAGVSVDERIYYLLNAKDLMLRMRESKESTPAQLASAELGFVQRCVASILHAEGRAEFATPEIIKNGGFRHDPAEDEIVFGVDMAKYRCKRGEFPTLDVALAASCSAASEKNAPTFDRPIDMDSKVQAMFESALDAFEQELNK